MIYLDHNATCPMADEVVEAMLPFFRDRWGNPSSSYSFGSALKEMIEKSRSRVAALIGGRESEVTFTSGASESICTAIHSMRSADARKKHFVTSVVEHSASLAAFKQLEREGFTVTYLPVARDGRIDPAAVDAAITDETAGVSVIWANNETGVLSDVEGIAKICHDRGVLLHLDAVQIAGKSPIKIQNLGAQYMSIAGHKIGGPKGIGVLYVKRRAAFTPLIHGGHQERGQRGGTESVALIAGLGVAAQKAASDAKKYADKVGPLRDSFEEAVLKMSATELNGHKTKRLPNTSNIWFRGLNNEALLLLLDKEGVCASSGSACLADSPDPSHVISAMKDPVAARESVRFSLGMETTQKELTVALNCLMRALSAFR